MSYTEPSIDYARNVAAAAQIRSSMEAADRRRRSVLDEKHGQIAGDGSVCGFVELSDVGEALVDVNFPYTFLEEPVPTFGYVFGASSWPEDGQFPLYGASVVQWTMNGRHYVGATLAISVSGSSGQEGKLSYRFEARSFANPVGGVTRVTDPL